LLHSNHLEGSRTYYVQIILKSHELVMFKSSWSLTNLLRSNHLEVSRTYYVQIILKAHELITFKADICI